MPCGKSQNQSAVLEHSVIVGERSGSRISLVHVNVMNALGGVKLVVDRTWIRCLAWCWKFGSEGEDLAILIFQLRQISDQHILQIVIGAWTGGGNRNSGRPIEQRRAKIIERGRSRTRSRSERRKARRHLRQCGQDRMILERIRTVEDHV